jgi:hypothetical protein
VQGLGFMKKISKHLSDSMEKQILFSLETKTPEKKFKGRRSGKKAQRKRRPAASGPTLYCLKR